jgi:hypothetical protein
MKFSRRSIIGSAAVFAPALILPRTGAEILRGEPPNIDQAYLTPFSVNSPWNIKPVSPVLGTRAIQVGPGGVNFPQMANTFSDQVFYATASDPPATVNAYVGDEINQRVVTIPHWPAGAVPATGSDHHMDIYDSTTQILHAFWELVNTGPGTWSAGMYTTYDINGTGWGSPSRPGGPRAAGLSAAAGLLRTWEQNNPVINHAIIFGCDQSLVANLPIFPSTMQDVNGYTNFTGPFQYGTLFMLPQSFDASGMNAQAQVVVQALKTYGGYLVDTDGINGGGGWNFYGEIGSTWGNIAGYTLQSGRNLNLDAIVGSLRAVTSVSGWVDRNNNPVTPTPWNKMQLLSMRGPWADYPSDGPVKAGGFNTVTNFYEFPDTTGIPAFNSRALYYDRDDSSVQPWNNWATFKQWYLTPTPGALYTLTCVGTNDAILKVYKSDFSANYFDSGVMVPGQSVTFNWPTNVGNVTEVIVGTSPGPPSKVRLELVAA